MSNPFLEAAEAGDLPSIKLILSEVAEIGGELRGIAMLLASAYGWLEIVVSLLREGGASIEARYPYEDSALLHAAQNGHLETVVWLLREGGSNIEEAGDDGSTALIHAAASGHLETLRWLVREGGARIGEVDHDGNSALILVASAGQLDTVKWLLRVGGSNIGEASTDCTALICAAICGKLETVQYLLEHEGADIEDTLDEGTKIWAFLARCVVRGQRIHEYDEPYVYDATAVTSLIRVIVLRGVPPVALAARLSPEHMQVAEDGARLRAWLPAYLAQRRALLDANCQLLPPLRKLVHGYEAPTTMDEL
jgi:ankyrin repeat protein